MGFAILYSVQDEKGKTSTTTINLPSAVAFADATLFAAELAKLINPLIGGAITRIGIAFTVALPAGLRASPLANSDVEEGARFQFSTTNGFFSGMRIPTFLESFITAGTKDVDLTDTDVAAFVAAMRDGIDLTGVGGSGTVQPSDSRDEDLAALSTAREQFISG